MSEEINDKPNNEVQERLRKLARGIVEEIPPGWAFVLITFPLDVPNAPVNYVSNGKPKQVVALLKNFIYRNKRNDVSLN